MDVAISRSRVAAGTRSLADPPFQLVLPQQHLLGDWYGVRTWLEGHGITPTLTFVMDALGNPSGGVRQGFRQASNLGLDLSFDLERLFGLAGGSFEVSLRMLDHYALIILPALVVAEQCGIPLPAVPALPGFGALAAHGQGSIPQS